MAKLIKCRTCGESIAKDAKVCPHCGAKNKKKTPWGVYVVCFFLIAWLLGSMATRNHENPSSAQTTPPAPTDSTIDVVFDAQKFMLFMQIDTTSKGYITVSEDELIKMIGEPDRIEEWNYETASMTYPIRSLSYDGGDYVYEFNNDYLTRIQIFESFHYEDKEDIIEMFGLSRTAKTEIVDTGKAYRAYNCMISDLWCTFGSEQNTIDMTYISYSDLFSK